MARRNHDEESAPEVEGIPADNFDADTPVEDAPAEKPARKPRTPRRVTDLTTASAAFKRAKRTADKADAALAQAQQNAESAHAMLTEAATALKSYTDEISAAADAELNLA
jgi:hypothetical protein